MHHIKILYLATHYALHLLIFMNRFHMHVLWEYLIKYDEIISRHVTRYVLIINDGSTLANQQPKSGYKVEISN